MDYNEPYFQPLLPANYDYWCKADVWTIRRGGIRYCYSALRVANKYSQL